MNRIAVAAISPILVLFSFAIASSARAQNPNEVSDDGGKTWHPYGESQSSSSSESSSSGLSANEIQARQARGALDRQAHEASLRHDYEGAIRYCEEALRINGGSASSNLVFQQN